MPTPMVPKVLLVPRPGDQSCASIIYQVRTAETTDEAGVVGAIEFGVVQQIRSFCGNLKFESLGDRKSSPQREVDVEAVLAREHFRLSVQRFHSSIDSGQCFRWESSRSLR